MPNYIGRERGPAPSIGKRCGACVRLLNQCWTCLQHQQNEERTKKHRGTDATPVPPAGDVVHVSPPAPASNSERAHDPLVPAPPALLVLPSW